jgi:hypothetical protein
LEQLERFDRPVDTRQKDSVVTERVTERDVKVSEHHLWASVG